MASGEAGSLSESQVASRERLEISQGALRDRADYPIWCQRRGVGTSGRESEEKKAKQKDFGNPRRDQSAGSAARPSPGTKLEPDNDRSEDLSSPIATAPSGQATSPESIADPATSYASDDSALR